MKLLKHWQHVQLGFVCSKIGSGATPRGGESVYVEEGTAIIRSQNVYNGLFTKDGLAHLMEEHAEQLKGVTVESHDVLLNITGDSVARCCQVPDWVLPARVNQHVAIVRPDSDQLLPEFLCYYFISPLMQKYLLSRAGSGGTRNALTKGMIEAFEVPCPLLATQQRIVDLLKNYDDLIESNHRRIQLLEQAARLLYKEWFVHLRFPGHEHVKIKDGIPEGWKRVLFGTQLSFHIGGGWGQDDYSSTETELAYVIRGTDFDAVRGGQLDEVGLRYHKGNSLKTRQLTPGDILFEVSGGSAIQPIGRTLLITSEILKAFDEDVICASFCKRFVSLNKNLAVYLFLFLDHIRNTGELMVYKKDSASALQNFNFKAFLEGQYILLPTELLLRQFTEITWRLQEQASLLAISIHRLKQARDLLLPRLMEGEFAV